MRVCVRASVRVRECAEKQENFCMSRDDDEQSEKPGVVLFAD